MDSGAVAWRDTQDTLEQLNQQLQSAVRAFPAQRLSKELGSEYPAYIQFCGAPQHDLYHAGEINRTRALLQDDDDWFVPDG